MRRAPGVLLHEPITSFKFSNPNAIENLQFLQHLNLSYRLRDRRAWHYSSEARQVYLRHLKLPGNRLLLLSPPSQSSFLRLQIVPREHGRLEPAIGQVVDAEPAERLKLHLEATG